MDYIGKDRWEKGSLGLELEKFRVDIGYANQEDLLTETQGC